MCPFLFYFVRKKPEFIPISMLVNNKRVMAGSASILGGRAGMLSSRRAIRSNESLDEVGLAAGEVVKCMKGVSLNSS